MLLVLVLVGDIGFEPMNDGFKTRCLWPNLANPHLMVQSTGIEPVSSDFQSGAITILAQNCLVPSDRIELPNPSCKGGVIPFNYEGYIALSLFPFLNPT